MAKLKSSSSFRPGHSGACEASLYTFTEYPERETETPRVVRIAASELLEAVRYMRQWHGDFRIQRVEALGLIELLSGSPLN
ncbi:MAG TPA: hypothetical protein VLJ11_10390 [Bryobacteraceae bacterium]|nr:hypothetical protein [Bryobacteraceae bacterium]